jgi:CHAT domain-containing protein
MESALPIIESQRGNISSSEMRLSYAATAREHYDLYISILMHLAETSSQPQYTVQALQASEKARARALLAALSESRLKIQGRSNSVLISRERDLGYAINARQEIRTRLLSNLSVPARDAQLVRVSQELEKFTAEHQKILLQIQANIPQYAALTQPRSLELTEIQQHLGDDQTLLLEFALGRDASWCWAVSRKEVHGYRLPARKVIESQVLKVWNLLNARQRVAGESERQRAQRIKVSDRQLRRAATTLSNHLLGKVTELSRYKRLLVVAEGALNYLPFGVLPEPDARGQSSPETVSSFITSSGENRLGEWQRQATIVPWQSFADRAPLIVRHEIVNLPSVSVIAGIRAAAAARTAPRHSLMIVADPVFEKDDPRITKLAGDFFSPSLRPEILPGEDLAALRSRGEGRRIFSESFLPAETAYSRLPYSRREALEIARLSSSSNAQVLLDFEASLDQVRQPFLADYQIVHFATHGVLNAERPEKSGIVLSLMDRNGQPREGHLQLQEIYNLHLPVQMVVLSACETALGKELSGEGMIGLTRGFMYAGAARIVNSLWKVEDSATAELMKIFYTCILKKEMSPAAALRQAKIEMMQKHRWESPYYWSAFMLHGEWQTL